MLVFLMFMVGMVPSAVMGANAFEALTSSGANLSEVEAQRYERVKNAPGVLRTRLMAVNDEMLSRGAWIELPFFENSRGGFRISKNENEIIIKGRSGQNFDRLIIRKMGGIYSGSVLFDGRQYAIVPVKKGVIALQELDGEIECGAHQTHERLGQHNIKRGGE